MSAERVRAIVTLMFALLLPAPVACQQRPSPTFAHIARAASLTLAPAERRSSAPQASALAFAPVSSWATGGDRVSESSRSPWRLPLIGAGVGAGLGALAVFAGCEQGSCFSESAGTIVGGAALGAVAGAAIELVRRVF